MAALADGTLFARWLEKRPGGATCAYDVRVTRSRDGGHRWGSVAGRGPRAGATAVVDLP